jgi:hypothetical protein
VLDVEVAERGLADRGLDAGDQVLRVDRRVDAVLAEHRDRDDVSFPMTTLPSRLFRLLHRRTPRVRAEHPSGQ